LRPLKPFAGCSELHVRLRCFSLYDQTAHVVPQPIHAEKRFLFLFSSETAFGPETVEKRLDLTSYMGYTYAEGRGSQSLTALIIRIAHIAR
jgi:hypothetical protein